MEIFKEKATGKHFLLIERRKGRKALMVSPEGKVEILELEHLDYMSVLGLKINVASELLTNVQLKIFYLLINSAKGTSTQLC